SMWGLITD
uniref:Uncharacterized protein n=1 Tax=Amphimedon queenslandica TaxID=400682 RepID=A0A1X7VPN6_AMPQE